MPWLIMTQRILGASASKPMEYGKPSNQRIRGASASKAMEYGKPSNQSINQPTTNQPTN